jgi:hypothetical protein
LSRYTPDSLKHKDQNRRRALRHSLESEVKHLSSAVTVTIAEDSACRQAQVHEFLDSLERVVSTLEGTTNRLHDRLYSVLDVHPVGDVEGKRPAYTVPMVEQIATIIDRINSVTDSTNSVINRLEI